MKPTRSLKARALQLLSQREQSQVELRRKLLAHLRAAEAASPTSGQPIETEAPIDPVDPNAQVQAVLDWLSTHQFASDERFAESRIHSRSSRFGNVRIRQELKQHAVALTPQAKQQLDDTEEARAASVYGRRFAAPPATIEERAKRARFLAARGFSPEVIRRVLRKGGEHDGKADSVD